MRLVTLLLLSQVLLVESKFLNLTDLDETLKDENLYSPLYNKSVEWGVYKPNVYFGAKNRQDHPLAIGIFWYILDEAAEGIQYLRHQYQMHTPDGKDIGVWAYYEFNDATSASRQIINDTFGNTNMTIEFYKELEEKQTPGEYISRWSVKATILSGDGVGDPKVVPVIYIAKEGKINNEDSFLSARTNGKKNFFKVSHNVDPATFEVESLEVGGSEGIEQSSMTGVNVPEDSQWQVDLHWQLNFKEIVQSAGGFINTTQPNIVYIKPTSVKGGQTLFLRYSKQVFSNAEEADAYSEVMDGDYLTTVAALDASIVAAKGYFDTKFAKVFGLGQDDLRDTMPLIEDFGKESLAQLLGGIGYYYGPIRIENKQDPQGWTYDEPAGLFTACPSRPYFPRGFLWDEGFHSMLTCQWSRFFCMDIISHWFYTIKQNGWIPREQMRGIEAESNLPYPLFEELKAGNPPTFYFDLDYLLQKAISEKDMRIITFLGKLKPKLKLWFSWFNTTQQNTGSLEGSYMWMDNVPAGALSSGLDDYPRGFRTSMKSMVNPDLQGWVILLSNFMGNFIDLLNGYAPEKDDPAPYQKTAKIATSSFHTWCWNDVFGLYSDRINYEANPTPPTSSPNKKYFSQQYKRMLSETSNPYSYKKMDDFSEHLGIINLFPIAFGLIDKVQQKDRLLNALQFGADKQHIWSEFGLRGVSMRDPSYYPDKGYWTGPIWISVNYMVLRGISLYYSDVTFETPISADGSIITIGDFSKQLRRNVLQTVYNSWTPQRLFYENFNDVTGKGQFSHPFTGWTTLVLLILSGKYI